MDGLEFSSGKDESTGNFSHSMMYIFGLMYRGLFVLNLDVFMLTSKSQATGRLLF